MVILHSVPMHGVLQSVFHSADKTKNWVKRILTGVQAFIKTYSQNSQQIYLIMPLITYYVYLLLVVLQSSVLMVYT